MLPETLNFIIIHQTHYKKSDWSRAFNQSTIACEIDIINAISAADIAFIMSSSTSAWLLSPLECSPQKQNGGRFASVSEDEFCEKCIIKQLLNLVFAWYHELSKPCVCIICLSPWLRQVTQTSVLIINNYSPKWRWLAIDIYRGAKRRGKYPTLAIDTEVNSCFSIY